MVTRERFETGLTYKDFLKDANDEIDLYQHHYEKTQISDQDYALVNPMQKELSILIITETRCPDSAVVLPVVLKLMERQANINLRILIRDDNLDVMDRYLTNGARAIPKIIVYDEFFNELGRWGPRPSFIQAYFEEHRSAIKTGEIDKVDVHKKMRQMYAKDRGQTIVGEFLKIVMKL